MATPRWRQWAEALREQVQRSDTLGGRALRVARQARPAAELGLLDRGTLRAWLRYVGPLGAGLGQEAEVAYTRLVLKATRQEPRLGRQLALTIPDQVARVPERERSTYLELLDVVLEQRPQALGMVARTLPELMERLSGPALRRFLGTGLDLHGGSERVAESFLRRESDRGQKELERLALGLALKDVSRALTLYARAHCGEDVQVRVADGAQRAFSEGRHVYLPERVNRFGDERDWLVYRVMTARTAGYLEFGSFDLNLGHVEGPWPARRGDEPELERLFAGFANRSLARDLFGVVEDARIEAAVVREYPGLARDIAVLRPEDLALRPDPADLAPAEQLVEGLLRLSWGAPAPEGLSPAVGEALRGAWALFQPALGPGATVEDVARALLQAYPLAHGLMRQVQEEDLKGPPSPDGGPRRGPRDPDEPGQTGGAAGEYGGLEESLMGSGLRPEEQSPAERQEEQYAREVQDAMSDEGLAATLSEIRRAVRARERGGQDERSYDEMMAFLERMPAPDGALVEQGDAALPALTPSTEPTRPQPGLDPDADPQAPSFVYPEWDHSIQDYKPAWVRVREHTLAPGSREFVDRVLDEQGPAIRSLRRTFQALRPEAVRRVRGLPDGDALDLDRVVEARVAVRAGSAPSDRLYSRLVWDQRDVAVAFLLDMSSSTNELAGEGLKRIIQVEKEALVLIAEAVDAIGDACAIWGFSGYSREHVAFYVAKEFQEPYDARAAERIGRMSWKMENRDGAAIRHATQKLRRHPAKTRLLILLSDGRPLDCGCDQYYDHYAHQDTRAALREARQAGVHPFCITVDPRGESYLESLYGEVGYVVIEDVEHLPQKLPRIYRRLTA